MREYQVVFDCVKRHLFFALYSVGSDTQFGGCSGVRHLKSRVLSSNHEIHESYESDPNSLCCFRAIRGCLRLLRVAAELGQDFGERDAAANAVAFIAGQLGSDHGGRR